MEFRQLGPAPGPPPSLARDLGTGFGTPPGLARLAEGQARKRSVLLRLLLDDADRHPDAGRARLREAYDYIVSTGQSDALLAYPNVGTWLVHAVRRLADRAPSAVPVWADLAYLGWVAAAHLITVRGAGRIDVIVRDGVVMLPGIGLARPAGPGTHTEATLTVNAGGIELTTDRTRLIVRDPGATSDERWLPLRRLGATYSGPRTIYLDDLDPFRDLSDPYTRAQLTRSPPRLTAGEAATWSRNFLGGLEILRQHHPDYAAGVDEVLRAVVPLTATPIANGVSNTTLHAYGNVHMSAAGGPHQFALTLIHECQHLKLTALTDQVELQKPSTAKDLYAPWRDDPRPLSGLLQGIYAHIGVTDFWRVHRRTAGSALADVEFARWRAQVRQALLVAAGSPLLTADGVAFVRALGAAVRHWSAERVPPHLESLAREASAGHLVAWRVRNMVVPDLPHEVDPHDLPPSTVTAPAQPSRARLPVGYLKLNRAAGLPVESAPASDLAYADGDHELALTLYDAEIRSAGAPESWAGFALSLRHLVGDQQSSALFQRPEVVAALFRRRPGDLVELTARLSS